MKDEDKTREELLAELGEIRSRITKLEELEVRVKGSERDLLDSERRYTFITENIGDVISQLDADLFFTYVSPSVRRLGYEPEEVVGKHLYAFLTRQSIELIDNIRTSSDIPTRRGVRGDESMIEVEFVAKDGTILPEEVLFSPFFDEDGTLILYHGVTRNITKRKQTEEALRESEEKFRHLFEKSVDAIVLIEGETYVDCNEAALAVIGASSKEQLIGLRPQDISPERQPDGRLSGERVRELNETTLKEGVNRFEWRRRALDGREFWIEVTQTVIPIGENRVLYTVWKDITERKSAGEVLNATTARLERASRVSRSGNWDLDLETMVITASEGACRIYGVEASKLPLTIVRESPLPEYRQALDAALRDLVEKGIPYDVEFKIRRTDSGEIVDIHSVAEYDPERRAVFGVIQDVTERRKAEEERRSSSPSSVRPRRWKQSVSLREG
jgi:PAS domain S-box-containing protein